MRVALVAAGILFVLVAATVAAFWYAAYDDRTRPPAASQIVVDRGSTFSEVAHRLAVAGIISNVTSFRILAHLRGEESEVRAGEYRFPARQTQDEILQALVTGGAQVAAWITIPEGFTITQIAQRLQKEGIGYADRFERNFKHRTLVVDGTPTKNLEGFLFPSTYLVPLGASPQQVGDMMVLQFFKELPGDAERRSRALHVTVPEVVTIASLVEREAKSQIDRPQIAEVIYNRLRLRMPLQVDATIEYALPQHKAQLSFGDLKIDSPYNTYLHPGLPPTPIANPGLPSLEAALHPSKGENLYYVYCGSGRHVFAKTLAEHQANVARCL